MDSKIINEIISYIKSDKKQINTKTMSSNLFPQMHSDHEGPKKTYYKFLSDEDPKHYDRISYDLISMDLCHRESVEIDENNESISTDWGEIIAYDKEEPKSADKIYILLSIDCFTNTHMEGHKPVLCRIDQIIKEGKKYSFKLEYLKDGVNTTQTKGKISGLIGIDKIKPVQPPIIEDPNYQESNGFTTSLYPSIQPNFSNQKEQFNYESEQDVLRNHGDPMQTLPSVDHVEDIGFSRGALQLVANSSIQSVDTDSHSNTQQVDKDFSTMQEFEKNSHSSTKKNEDSNSSVHNGSDMRDLSFTIHLEGGGQIITIGCCINEDGEANDDRVLADL
ncbi:hypothetical protein ACTFIU_005688 [Dictyostelium citrinum]